jgi:hypothetical protein
MNGLQNNQTELEFAQNVKVPTGMSKNEKNKIYMRKWRKENPEEAKEAAEKYKAWRLANPDRRKQSRDKWNESHPALVRVYARKANKKWSKANLDKRNANLLVHRAIEKGLLIKGTKCQRCGMDNCVICAHHQDYSKPLDVDWVCHKCHSIIHGIAKKG